MDLLDGVQHQLLKKIFVLGIQSRVAKIRLIEQAARHGVVVLPVSVRIRLAWYGMVWYGMAGVERLASLHKGLWDPGVRVVEKLHALWGLGAGAQPDGVKAAVRRAHSETARVVQNGPARAHAWSLDHPTVVGPVPPSRRVLTHHLPPRVREGVRSAAAGRVGVY